jgi:curved DNA-binding protein CbpA
MLKKSTIVLSSYTSLQGIYTPSSPPTTPRCLNHRHTDKRKSVTRPPNQQYRNYAMTAGGYSRNEHETLPWPEATAANAIPTPYQIFNQRKGSPYSKRRFYELVKLYHPDRHNIDGVSDSIPYATKLERYRLVVAANELLSDPVKREAYDCYGAGWNGQPGIMGPRNASDTAGGWGDYAGRGWGGGRGGPFQNATWEDWERWYARGEKAEQSPTYISNGAFVALIVMFAALGGVGQATRVGNYSMNFIEQRDALHDEMSKELMRRRRESNSLANRDERVHTFLKQRDPFGYGVTDPEEEAYRRVLPESEVCSSDDIQRRSMDVYDVKKATKS